MFKRKKKYPAIVCARTEAAFEDIENSILKDMPVICMKNGDGRFGSITKGEILAGNFNIWNRTKEHWEEYEDLKAMLNDGWVVD